MTKLKDFGPAFARLNEDDKVAILTAVAEIPKLHGNDLSERSIASVVRRFSTSREGLELAREFYGQWKLAGKQSDFVSRAIKHSPGRGIS